MSTSIALLRAFLKVVLPVCLVYLLGSAIVGYLNPKPEEPMHLLALALSAFGTWYLWLRNTRKGVT